MYSRSHSKTMVEPGLQYNSFDFKLLVLSAALSSVSHKLPSSFPMTPNWGKRLVVVSDARMGWRGETRGLPVTPFHTGRQDHGVRFWHSFQTEKSEARKQEPISWKWEVKLNSAWVFFFLFIFLFLLKYNSYEIRFIFLKWIILYHLIIHNTVELPFLSSVKTFSSP